MSPGLGVAVVGGGAFGAKAAIDLARSGHTVDLFEKRSDLLMAASGINQYRLHRGYHYPRSLPTAIECRRSELLFREAFAEAVADSAEHFYAVAAEGSRTSADAYQRFCERAGLEYQRADLGLLRSGSVALVLRVREAMFDPNILRRLLSEQLRRSGVKVHLSTVATRKILSLYDLVVVAAYSEINALGSRGLVPEVYQYEVCEKPVVRLPAAYAKHSVVVMDGPFMCVDPLPGTDLFVLGNVVHAIHHSNVGPSPEVPRPFRRLLNRGIVAPPALTKFDEFIRSGNEFFVDFDRAEHVGSMFTVRAVLPGVDRTDARPTLIRRVSDGLITVFSGKIDTCVPSAQQITDIADALAFGRPTLDPERALSRRRPG